MSGGTVNRVGQVLVPREISLENSTYFDKLATSVTGWWVKPKGGQNTEREKILSVTFDTFELDGETRRCMILVYLSGYQVWDITDMDHICEIYSARGLSCITFARMVPTPAMKEEEDAPFYGDRPVLLLVQEDESNAKTASVLKFVSLRTSQMVPLHGFKYQILDVQCNSHVICLRTTNYIYLLNPITMSRINVINNQSRITCFPDSAVSLGSRWLAYATLDTANEMLDQPISTIDVAKDVGIRVASTLASTYSLAVSAYMGTEDIPATPASEKEKQKLLKEAEGTVAIYDVVDNVILYKIKAHKEAISHLAFDDSGTLLCTASISGNSLNIIRLHSTVNWESGKKRISLTGTHLYTLYRGHTSATISSIKFTCDSKWVAVQTGKGTTHLFAVNPEGGEVNTRTHPPLAEKSSSCSLGDTKYNDKKPEMYIIYALARLHQTEDAQRGPFHCSFIPGRSRKLLTTSPNGTLTQNQLQPVRSMDSENNTILTLNIVPEQEWDINRKLNMLEVNGNFTSIAKLTNQMGGLKSPQGDSTQNQWASYSETNTFDANTSEAKKVLVTKRPLFQLQSYDEEGGVDLAETVLMFPKGASQKLRPSVSPYFGSPKANIPQKEPKSPDSVVNSLQAAMNTKLDKKSPQPSVKPAQASPSVFAKKEASVLQPSYSAPIVEQQVEMKFEEPEQDEFDFKPVNLFKSKKKNSKPSNAALSSLSDEEPFE